MLNVSESTLYSHFGATLSGVMARGAKPRIGAHNLAISEYLQAGDSDIFNCFALFTSLQLRDSIYQRFRANRKEVSTLWSLHGYLIAHNKVLVSQAEFIGHLTGNFNTKTKIHGYIAGLFTLKAIASFEYTKCPGSISIGITDFGLEILKAYWQEMNELFGRYMKAKKPIKKPVKYPDLSLDIKSISVAENIPLNYRPHQKVA